VWIFGDAGGIRDMSESSTSFGAELRVSAKPIIAVLAVTGFVIIYLGDTLRDSSDQYNALLLTGLVYVLAIVAWLLDGWWPLAGRWMTVASVLAVVYLGSTWLGSSGFLLLAPIPVGLAASMISLPAAAATAASETVMLLTLPGFGAAGIDPGTALIGVTAVWGMLGLMWAAYRPINQLGRWVWDYYEAAQVSLSDARNRRAELEGALDNLAHANRQIALANERLAALRLIAEDAQKTKATFVANVSHEFRTPLNMIIGLVELIVETPEIYAMELPPEAEQDLAVVLRNCKHLSSMIDDVLDLTRMEAGRITLHMERIDLGGVVEEAVAAVRPLVEKKGLGLGVRVADDLPTVYCDRTRIRQVVLNLVSNAARFTDRGGIDIDVDGRDSHVVLRVTDTGPGIPPEDAKRIFEPFSQGTSDIRSDKGGSGLGLSISQQFVKLHRGQLLLETEVGVGSSFICELPFSPPMEHQPGPRHWIREDWVWRQDAFRTDRAWLADQPRKPRVAICDADDVLPSEFAPYADDLDLVPAGNLSEAAQGLQECPADVVMLNAPSETDLVSLVLEARQAAPRTPIIGCSVPAQTGRSAAAGAMGHLTKPVSRDDLIMAIQSVGRPVRRVLVVDDDADALRLFRRMLSICDEMLEVETVASGQRALDRLRSRSYDLVLLDVVMPDMNGWQVLERLRREKGPGDPPVFFLSAHGPADHPPTSQVLLATIDEGLSISKLLRCSLELSAVLLTPEGELDPTPPQTAGLGPVSTGSTRRPATVPALPL
jgi:signal transduction histidine kinase/CheY-like chemotaxis protein